MTFAPLVLYFRRYFQLSCVRAQSLKEFRSVCCVHFQLHPSCAHSIPWHLDGVRKTCVGWVLERSTAQIGTTPEKAKKGDLLLSNLWRCPKVVGEVECVSEYKAPNGSQLPFFLKKKLFRQWWEHCCDALIRGYSHLVIFRASWPTFNVVNIQPLASARDVWSSWLVGPLTPDDVPHLAVHLHTRKFGATAQQPGTEVHSHAVRHGITTSRYLYW